MGRSVQAFLPFVPPTAIANDSHVADLRATKAWADPAGVFVRFEEIG